mmetsp:Transcript_30286/g.60800  ORF Transcript_30286/g.60800 Transcript_30286/m.60800 type:complete len:201 (+) Transcript_30286:3190-3792(+)
MRISVIQTETLLLCCNELVFLLLSPTLFLFVSVNLLLTFLIGISITKITRRVTALSGIIDIIDMVIGAMILVIFVIIAEINFDIFSIGIVRHRCTWTVNFCMAILQLLSLLKPLFTGNLWGFRLTGGDKVHRSITVIIWSAQIEVNGRWLMYRVSGLPLPQRQQIFSLHGDENYFARRNTERWYNDLFATIQRDTDGISV